MENQISEQAFEQARLEQTISIAQEQLSAARLRNKENQEAIVSAKRELRENTSHSISNLWSMENFHQLVELGQYANPVLHKISEYELEANKILVLERMINSPYFARIDFKATDESNFESIYIGLSSLKDDKTYEIYVYDWRAPISSVFYRFGTGNIFYDSPGGKVTLVQYIKRARSNQY